MALRTLGSLLTRRLSPRAQAQAEPWLLYSGGGGGDGEASILQWCVGRVGRSSASRQEHRGFGFRRMDLRREFDWNLYIAQRNAHGRFISNDPDVSLNAIKQ
uniref:Uncharacterized protein n=1 Tax=Oryza nivara TaxID=4536 RepID=A0A0E0HGG4_ORYNI